MLDRETGERIEDADTRIGELKAQCSAMREALEMISDCRGGRPECATEALAALSNDAGRALMERGEALERVADVVRKDVNWIEDWPELTDAVLALDALEPKR